MQIWRIIIVRLHKGRGGLHASQVQKQAEYCRLEDIYYKSEMNEQNTYAWNSITFNEI